MSGNCRSWLEELYWKHFQFIHFSQFFHSGFHQHLAIPDSFCRNLKKKFPETVSLRGPSGGIWEVGLTMDNDMLFFTLGWEEFVKDHFLRENDLLIFKYDGDSCFDVLIFDGQSLCERESSYFVRKCRHGDRGRCCQSKRKIGETSAEGPSPVDGCNFPEKSVNSVTETSQLGWPIMLKTTNKNTQTEMELCEPIHDLQSVRSEEPSTWADEIESNPDVRHIFVSDPNLVHDVPNVSCTRLVTEEEKQNALRLAQAALTSDGFIQVMKPTHLHRKFYMGIPVGWMIPRLEALQKGVILRIKENTWETKFHYRKAINHGGLSSGWRKFAKDNKLQEFDVCVFEPCSAEDNSIVLDVNIFRVVQ